MSNMLSTIAVCCLIIIIPPSRADAHGVFSACFSNFREIGVRLFSKFKVTYPVPFEIQEINLVTNDLQAMGARTEGKLWQLDSASAFTEVTKAFQAKEISVKTHEDLKSIFKILEKAGEVERGKFAKLISVASGERTVATVLRHILAKPKTERRIFYLFDEFEKRDAEFCLKGSRPQCSADALDYIIGVNRRPVSDRDLRNQIGKSPGANYQVSTKSRLTDGEAKVVAAFFENAKNVTHQKSKGWSVDDVPFERLPHPVRKYLTGIEAAVRKLDPEAEIDFFEILKVTQDFARSPFTHADGGSEILMLSSLRGYKTWMQGFDGQFFQAEQLGDAVLYKSAATSDPKAHLGPIDPGSPRVLVRISLKSPKFYSAPIP